MNNSVISHFKTVRAIPEKKIKQEWPGQIRQRSEKSFCKIKVLPPTQPEQYIQAIEHDFL